MRQCINSSQVNTTAATQAYLLANPDLIIRHLYMIGYPEDPNAIFLTDHESPVTYEPWGTFHPAVVQKGTVTAKIGLEVQKTTVTWTPSNLTTGNTIPTANPLQLARLHYFDNWPVRIWKMFMPTPGDTATLGGCAWFGGRVGSCVVGRNQIEFSVSSFLDIVTQKLPANVIESTSTLAGFTAATLPTGDTSTPIFTVFTGSSTNVIYGDVTGGTIYSQGQFIAGYLVFLAGPGATLAGVWSAIGNNKEFSDGHGNHHNEFDIYTALPWAPTPGVDTFYVSTAAPINAADGDYYGFPFVPQPTQAA